jgi:DNA-binding NtrC family response regulator
MLVRARLRSGYTMTRVGARRGVKRALVVDPDPAFANELAGQLRPYADVTTCSGFPGARTQLRELKPQFLITALALHEYNGLHLVYLAGADGLPTRSIVYCKQLDVGLAAEVQAAGAFFELRHRLTAALPVYAAAMSLPPSDRRLVTRPDRRYSPRGGRRATDEIAATV